MKKFIATVLLLMFTSLSANATTQVFFGNTGRPVSYSRGFHRSSMHNFGSNAAFTPANRAYAGFRNRQIKTTKSNYKSHSCNSTKKYAFYSKQKLHSCKNNHKFTLEMVLLITIK